MSKRRRNPVDLVDDLPALLEYLYRHPRFRPELWKVLPALQERPGALDTLRAGLREYQHGWIDEFRHRTVLTGERPTVESFCELATERARRRDPSFPAVTHEDLETKAHGPYGRHRVQDTRVDGRGWVLEVEERDEGPAEAVHVDEWAARAYGDGWAMAVRYDTTSGDVWVWEEPIEPAPGEGEGGAA